MNPVKDGLDTLDARLTSPYFMLSALAVINQSTLPSSSHLRYIRNSFVRLSWSFEDMPNSLLYILVLTTLTFPVIYC